MLLSWEGLNVLIDTPPELRLQLLKNHIDRVDALLFTHCHADHVYGLDDVRIFCRDRRLPVYGDAVTLKEMKRIFPYVFRRTQKAGGKPRVRLKPFKSPFSLFKRKVVPLTVYHGNKKVSGFRVGGFAYISDCSRIPAATFSLLTGLKVLIIDALRDEFHPTHFSLPESMEAARRIGAEKTFFTHIAHNLDHDQTNRRLPSDMRLAHDGLRLRLP